MIFEQYQHRPANLYKWSATPDHWLYSGELFWYQGETNASRAAAYNYLFPLLIRALGVSTGTKETSPFYWAQLADFTKELPKPQQNSLVGELREAQTNGCLAPKYRAGCVIIDIGEGRDIHPRNKRTVADRLICHALSKDYGFKIASEKPAFFDMLIMDDRVIGVTFEHVSSGGLYAFDVPEVMRLDTGADGVSLPEQKPVSKVSIKW